jgi:hypothetical protein
MRVTKYGSIAHLHKPQCSWPAEHLIKVDGHTPQLAHTLSASCSGQAALMMEQWEQLDSNHHENQAMGKHSPQKRNGGMPISYLGPTALRWEECSMYSHCWATTMI